jgi:hypothetical protein
MFQDLYDAASCGTWNNDTTLSTVLENGSQNSHHNGVLTEIFFFLLFLEVILHPRF